MQSTNRKFFDKLVSRTKNIFSNNINITNSNKCTE